MAKSPMIAKQNELQKKKKAHEATLEKLAQLKAQADAEISEINQLESEIAALRQTEQEKQLNAMAFGQGYDGDSFEEVMPDLAFLLDPKTRAVARDALAAVRARAESAENSGVINTTEKTEG